MVSDLQGDNGKETILDFGIWLPKCIQKELKKLF